MTDEPQGAAPRAPPPRTVYAPPPLRVSLLRMAVVLLFCIAVAYGAHTLMQWVATETEKLDPGMGRMVRGGVLAGLLLAYALLIAVPFVPGVEIGLSLLVMRGAEVAPFVYLATLAGLALAFAAGRVVPHDWLRHLFLDLRMTRACRLLDAVQQLSPEERAALLRRRLPRWLGLLAGGGRYLMLAVLVNLPGSAVIGGGGGILLVAGLTRLFGAPATLATLALAVLPLPLAVWLWGPGFFT